MLEDASPFASRILSSRRALRRRPCVSETCACLYVLQYSCSAVWVAEVDQREDYGEDEAE